MTDTSIQAFQPDNGALSAESYQTFELAKENDSVLGGDDIAQLLVYTASARAKAQAIHAAMAATRNLDDATTLRADAVETEQTFARVSIYGDQRIGEILRELPTRQGTRTDTTSCTPMQEVTKAQAIENSGISSRQAYDLQKLAANPDVVQAVLDRAEAEGRIPSRKQVLDAIRERDEARDEIAALEKQNDELYELANTQQVVEREVVRTVAPEDYEDVKQRVRELEGSNRLYADDNRSLRKQLEEAQSSAYDHERIMDAARLEADVFRRKYSELSELADVISAIDQFLSA